jgi:hypothetical protein
MFSELATNLVQTRFTGVVPARLLVPAAIRLGSPAVGFWAFKREASGIAE